jgi:hypothetical protein
MGVSTWDRTVAQSIAASKNAPAFIRRHRMLRANGVDETAGIVSPEVALERNRNRTIEG